MQEIPNQERESEPSANEAETVVQALDSDNPEVKASALNATLSLLFRLNGVTQQRRTQEQLDRETALIQLPVAEALQSDDDWVRHRAGGVMSGFVAALDEIAHKKQRVEQMIQELREEIGVARRARRARTVRAVLLFVAAAALFVAQGSRLFMFWWMIFPVGGFWNIDRSRRQTFIQRLRETWDPRAVGVLAIVAQDRDADLSHHAEQALLGLLPRVRASDAAYVDSEGMLALIELLKEDYDALRLAVLQALEQIGDERAIPMVTDLRDAPRIHLEVRQAAAECLPALENRVRLARESATLLRASSGLNASEAAAQLLRPTSGASAATDNLLRPTGNGLPTSSNALETTDPPIFSVNISSDPVSDKSLLRSRTSLP